jgi:hypothetical protein
VVHLWEAQRTPHAGDGEGQLPAEERGSPCLVPRGPGCYCRVPSASLAGTIAWAAARAEAAAGDPRSVSDQPSGCPWESPIEPNPPLSFRNLDP